MNKNNTKKSEQLGMPYGTACSKLRKTVLFSLVQKLGEDKCFQCGKRIEEETNFSIEHKVPFLNSANPSELFFDINNISFSHLSCNTGAARREKITKHPSCSSYMKGCRCEECRNIERLRRQDQRSRGINT